MSGSEKIQVYDLTLTTTTPLFIGDGRTLPKKSYVYDWRQGKVSFFDENKFFSLLLEKDLIDKYERSMLDRETDLYSFLKYICKLTEQDLQPAVRCQMDAADPLDPDHSLKDIHTFIRNAYGQAYVPGSSVKGALRTILLHQTILREGPHPRLEGSRGPNSMGKIPEERYLHTLELNKKRPSDMANSILRGIQVSDSLPIPDTSMMIAMKRDVHRDGSVGCVNVCRESVRPGTKIRLKLTLDRSILKGSITREMILQAIDEFDAYYWDTYFQKFATPESEGGILLYLQHDPGGGSGFFAKSLVYPYLGEREALAQTSAYMKEHYPKSHKHYLDQELEIAPHTIKYTGSDGKLYPMGLCEVDIQRSHSIGCSLARKTERGSLRFGRIDCMHGCLSSFPGSMLTIFTSRSGT